MELGKFEYTPFPNQGVAQVENHFSILLAEHRKLKEQVNALAMGAYTMHLRIKRIEEYLKLEDDDALNQEIKNPLATEL